MFLKRFAAFFPFFIRHRQEMALGIAALVVTDLAGLFIPWLLKEFIDLLPQVPARATLLKYSALIFLAACVQGLSRFGWRKYLFGTSRKVELEVLNRLFEHFLSLDIFFYQKQKIGDLMSRATNDLRAVRDFVGLGLLILVDSSLVIVCSVTLMFFIHPGLTLWVLLPLPLVTVMFFGFIREISKRHEVVQAHLSKITARVQENLAGIRVLHAFVQEEHEKRKFDTLNRQYIEKNLRVTRLFGIFTPSLTLTTGVAALVSLWLGSQAVIAGEMTLGAFVAFNGYLLMLSWPMMGIGYVVNLSQKGLSAMGRIQEILDARPLVREPLAKTPASIQQGKIEIKDLSFTYPNAESKSLSDIHLSVLPGQTLAVVGRVGSGKSTLASLLPRLFDAGEGQLKIDGRRVQDIPIFALRESIGYVDQEPYLFSMTIRENIALGRADASDREIAEMVETAGLVPDLDRFPDGLETLVGERGVSLSGGQKQRIALARALLKNPKILVLDDALSSLDAGTEKKVLGNLKQRFRDVTTVMVTHRLSQIQDADEILVLKRGRIVERGDHIALLKQNGFYSEMVRAQDLAREMEIALL